MGVLECGPPPISRAPSATKCSSRFARMPESTSSDSVICSLNGGQSIIAFKIVKGRLQRSGMISCNVDIANRRQARGETNSIFNDFNVKSLLDVSFKSDTASRRMSRCISTAVDGTSSCLLKRHRLLQGDKVSLSVLAPQDYLRCCSIDRHSTSPHFFSALMWL